MQKAAPTPIKIEAVQTIKDLNDWVSKQLKTLAIKKIDKGEGSLYNQVCEKIVQLQLSAIGVEDVGTLSERANTVFQKIFPTLTLKIDQNEPNTKNIEDLLAKNFNISINDTVLEGLSQNIASQGTGVIRQAMFNFLGLISQDEVDEGEVRKKFLVLYEEPEVFLHPSKIRLLRKALYELSESSPFQILCASHNPQLIDLTKDQTSLVRCVKNSDATVEYWQVGRDIFASNDDDKERLQMINRFNPHVCEAFFADEVIVVEGDTEAIVLRELLPKLSESNEIFILNAGSKTNIPFFQKILTHFRIKHHVIHDCDTKFLYDEDDNPITKLDGENKISPAWGMNRKIWEMLIDAKNKDEELASRYVHVKDFETANNYTVNSSEGKPLSAYNFAKDLDIEQDLPILNFIKEIVGEKEREEEFLEKDLFDLINR
jgi:predicted ATP-dependent endonuclease of OLD family